MSRSRPVKQDSFRLRSLSHDPAAIRLLVLVVRQTGGEFSRRLANLLGDLGWDPGHPAHARGRLEAALTKLQTFGVIRSFAIAPEEDRLTVVRNPDWHRGSGPGAVARGLAG